MSSFTMKLPDVGEGVAEAEIVEWLVAVGDAVTPDSPIAAVLTAGQKTKFEALKGPKFELARRSPTRSRGGRGGQGKKGQGGRPKRPTRPGAKKKGVA